MNLRSKILLFITVSCLFIKIKYIGACNEAICASIVSKCLLLNVCNCTLSNCSCCNECFSCLSDLYGECCSCINMCPQPYSKNNLLHKSSYIEDLSQPVAELFETLTDKPDDKDRWMSFRYPMNINIKQNFPNQHKETPHLMSRMSHNNDNDHQVNSEVEEELKCSVAFITNCVSWNKCKLLCQSMGAKSYRWFHNGCCECIRDTCINYGINESRCKNCPTVSHDFENEISEAFDDYGQDDYDDYLYDYAIHNKSIFDILH